MGRIKKEFNGDMLYEQQRAYQNDISEWRDALDELNQIDGVLTAKSLISNHITVTAKGKVKEALLPRGLSTAFDLYASFIFYSIHNKNEKEAITKATEDAYYNLLFDMFKGKANGYVNAKEEIYRVDIYSYANAKTLYEMKEHGVMGFLSAEGDEEVMKNLQNNILNNEEAITKKYEKEAKKFNFEELKMVLEGGYNYELLLKEVSNSGDIENLKLYMDIINAESGYNSYNIYDIISTYGR